MDSSLTALVAALRSPDWSKRLAAIEVVVENGDHRLRHRLRQLSRFHVAPRRVRAAAARAAHHLDGLVADGQGRLSSPPIDPLTGRVAVDSPHED